MHSLCSGIEDMPNLLKLLTEVAANWRTVGIYLKIAPYQLEAIRTDTSGRANQTMECLTDMLANWLKGTDASPAVLVHALRSAGMTVLARKIAVKYG